MPLPAALLAKLKQRGIVEEQKKKEDEEEVFAENYDDSDESESSDEDDHSENEETESPKAIKEIKEVREPTETSTPGYKTFDCPNSKNPYHECTSYCRKKYGAKRFEPHPIMEKRRLRMLKIYPLLPNWKEVPDLNTNRYYYWNTETDQVCWLSPSHPKARYVTHAEQHVKAPVELPRIVSQAYHDEPECPEPSRTNETRPENNKSKSVPYHKRSKKEPELDPMDPASYSDIKKGKWSDGMDSQSSVKVGSSVDEE